MLEISLAAEPIAHIGSFPVTNSLLATWSVMAILFILSWQATRNMKEIPGNFQSIMESVLEALYSFFTSIVGSHHIKKVFPLAASLFLFIIIANWEGLLPGVGTIGFWEDVKEPVAITEEKPTAGTTNTTEIIETKVSTEVIHETSVAANEANEAPKEETVGNAERKFVPLLRAATADLNMTVGLAIIAVLAIQYFGFSALGFHYSRRFLNFKNPIMFFIGILEIISDLSKMISFAFRLFGNIFAGEVLLAVIAFLIPFIAPLPFLMLELFVGFIQAIVFSTLTSVFVNVAVSHEE